MKTSGITKVTEGNMNVFIELCSRAEILLEANHQIADMPSQGPDREIG